MALVKLGSANQVVDELVERLCIVLAITDTQHARATSAYKTVGKWIAADDSPLAKYNPVVFPQGSIPLGTTVRPRQSEEFDADGVCLLDVNQYLLTPQNAYDLILKRIRDHETYREKVNPQDRCIRIDYEDQMHLDIIPAVPAGDKSNPLLILIPTHDRQNWQSTNPKGYQNWLRSRQPVRRLTEKASAAEKRGEVEPMPAAVEAEERTPLQRICQLLKRRRDVYFDGDGLAPKSILLTTLAGIFYNGQELATDGMISILEQILSQSEGAAAIPVVSNPSNPGENLARHWQESPRSYPAFLDFSSDLRARMQNLLDQRGTKNIALALQEMFDPTDTGIVAKAVESYTKDFQDDRSAGNIKLGTGGLTTSVITAKDIPPTKFYGSR